MKLFTLLMKSMLKSFTHVVAISFVIIISVGCNGTVEPFSESGSYSVYGNLSFEEEAHFFRVRPLNQSLEASADSLNATVALTNQSDGTTRILEDSVVVFGGVPTHNYWAEFKVEPTTTYEMRITGPSGPATTVQTTTPTAVDPVVVPKRANKCGAVMEVRFREAKSPAAIEVGFHYEGTEHWVRRSDVEDISAREDKILRFNVASLLCTVIPCGPFEPPPCTQLDDPRLDIAYLYTDPERSAEDVNSEFSFDPTQQERVTNGVGFFGAFRRDTISAAVDTTLSLSS